MLCKICKKPVKGRYDKIFCSISCKNEYHVKLRRATRIASKESDKILHRNRSILLEILGKNTKQLKVKREVLDKKKFNFAYVTGYYINNKGKIYNYLYDFRWMLFSDKDILIVRHKT